MHLNKTPGFPVNQSNLFTIHKCHKYLFFQLTSQVLNLIQHVKGKSFSWSKWPRAMEASLALPEPLQRPCLRQVRAGVPPPCGARGIS